MTNNNDELMHYGVLGMKKNLKEDYVFKEIIK